MASQARRQLTVPRVGGDHINTLPAPATHAESHQHRQTELTLQSTTINYSLASCYIILGFSEREPRVLDIVVMSKKDCFLSGQITSVE